MYMRIQLCNILTKKVRALKSTSEQFQQRGNVLNQQPQTQAFNQKLRPISEMENLGSKLSVSKPAQYQDCCTLQQIDNLASSSSSIPSFHPAPSSPSSVLCKAGCQPGYRYSIKLQESQRWQEMTVRPQNGWSFFSSGRGMRGGKSNMDQKSWSMSPQGIWEHVRFPYKNYINL